MKRKRLTNKAANGTIITEKRKALATDPSGRLKPTEIEMKKRRKRNDTWTSLEYMNVGYFLIVPLLLGIGAGLVLDKVMKSTVFIVPGIVLGTVGSFYNLWKLVKDIDKED